MSRIVDLIMQWFGGVWPRVILIAGFLAGIIAIIFKFINIGKAEQKAADQEVQIQNEQAVDKHVTDALNAGNRVDTGSLHDDDGHKRAD